MKRYQVYLNQHSVSFLDEFEEVSNISRSKLIRDLIDRAAAYLVDALAPVKKGQKTRYLDKLSGFIDLKSKEKTHFAENVDEIYEGIY